MDYLKVGIHLHNSAYYSNCRKYLTNRSNVYPLIQLLKRTFTWDPKWTQNRFEISLQDKISLLCEVTSLSAFTWLRVEWNSLRCKFHFGQIDQRNFKPQWVFHVNSKCPQWDKVAQNHLKLLSSAHVFCYYCLKNNQWRNICFGLIEFALIKKYHLHMHNRAFPLFEKLPQRNLHVNCHVNRTTFQSVLRFQTGLSSFRVSCKHALKCLVNSCKNDIFTIFLEL